MPKIVADVMTRDPIDTRPDTPLNQVIKTLAEKRISGLPVVDDNGKLAGILSEGDLMWRETGATPPPYILLLDSVIYLENPNRYEQELHKALGETVQEVMTNHHVVTITPEKSVREAAQLMHDRGVHHLPVIDANDRVVGILNRNDIIRAMATELDENQRTRTGGEV